MMSPECQDTSPANQAVALLYSLEERGIIAFLPGTTYVDLGYHCNQWYGEKDEHAGVEPPNET